MSKNVPVSIEAAANGFIVIPDTRETGCRITTSGTFVFSQFDDMVKWLGEHFEKPAEQAK